MPTTSKQTAEPKPLTALEDKIAANAREQARSEFADLEKYLAEWSKNHEAGYNNKGFWASPNRSFDPSFTTPNELYQTEQTKGWKGFRENFVRDRAKQLAQEIAAALLAKIELLP